MGDSQKLTIVIHANIKSSQDLEDIIEKHVQRGYKLIQILKIADFQSRRYVDAYVAHIIFALGDTHG